MTSIALAICFTTAMTIIASEPAAKSSPATTSSALSSPATAQSAGDEFAPAAAAMRGKVAPDFSLPTADGKTISLAAEKGKVVLIDFWATWCVPCRAELPHIDALANDSALSARGLKVWAIDVQDEAAAVRGFCKKNKLTLTTPLDLDGKVNALFNATEGLPITFIVGRDGIIRNVFIAYGAGRDEQIKAAVDAALKA